MNKTEYRKLNFQGAVFIVGTDGSIDGQKKWSKLYNGYMHICRTVDGKKKHFLVHRIVAAAWLEPPLFPNMTQIDHINGIKTDNRAENLRWVSKSENEVNKYRLRGKRVVAVNTETGAFFQTTTVMQMSRIIGLEEQIIRRYAKSNKPYRNYFIVIGDAKNGGEG